MHQQQVKSNGLRIDRSYDLNQNWKAKKGSLCNENQNVVVETEANRRIGQYASRLRYINHND